MGSRRREALSLWATEVKKRGSQVTFVTGKVESGAWSWELFMSQTTAVSRLNRRWCESESF